MRSEPMPPLKVVIVNPERLPHAERTWHRTACVCRGAMTCQDNKEPSSRIVVNLTAAGREPVKPAGRESTK